MTNTLNNSSSSGANWFDRALDQGLSNRLTLIVGDNAGARSQELEEWLEGIGYESLRIQCAPEACSERIVEAFTSAGIVDPAVEPIESEDACQLQLVRLMNGLAALRSELVVVLLDYQPCERADQVLSFMLEHLPQQIHLYLVTTDVPSLSCIPRLRVRRQFQLIDAAG